MYEEERITDYAFYNNDILCVLYVKHNHNSIFGSTYDEKHFNVWKKMPFLFPRIILLHSPGLMVQITKLLEICLGWSWLIILSFASCLTLILKAKCLVLVKCIYKKKIRVFFLIACWLVFSSMLLICLWNLALSYWPSKKMLNKDLSCG